MPYRRSDRAAGFTIIELMVVIAVIGLLMMASSLTLRNLTNSDLRSAASRTAAAMRFAFDRATMTGSTLRLALDLEKGEIWAEATEDRVTLQAGEAQHTTKKKQDRRDSSSDKPDPLAGLLGGALGGEGEEGMGAMGIDVEALTADWKADLAPAKRSRAHFTPIKSLVGKKIKLAKRISIEAVMTPRLTEPTEKGTAHIYFFPQGSSEPAIVHFVDGSEKYYSVVLHPLTGQAKVYPCMIEIPEEFGVSDDKRGRRRGRDPCREKGGI